jgi:hypothetical protein
MSTAPRARLDHDPAWTESGAAGPGPGFHALDNGGRTDRRSRTPAGRLAPHGMVEGAAQGSEPLAANEGDKAHEEHPLELCGAPVVHAGPVQPRPSKRHRGPRSTGCATGHVGQAAGDGLKSHKISGADGAEAPADIAGDWAACRRGRGLLC